MIGLIKLGLGVARLGALVNFISTTVVIGFTAGAGLLIIAAQLQQLLRASTVPQQPSFVGAISVFRDARPRDESMRRARSASVTLVAALAGASAWLPRVPYLLTGDGRRAASSPMSLARLGVAHVATIGALPSAVPRLSLPDCLGGHVALARADRASPDADRPHRGDVERARRRGCARASASTATRSSSARASPTSSARSPRAIRRRDRSIARAPTTKPARARRSRPCSPPASC